VSGAPPRAAGRYLRFLAQVATATIAAALLGALPTLRLGGEGALLAMAVGCGISALGSAVGGLPFALSPPAAPQAAATRALLAAVLRPLVVLGLGLAAALSRRFATAPLLIWLAVSYVLLLVLDTRYAVEASGDTNAKGR
jgi:hypothetical protein